MTLLQNTVTEPDGALLNGWLDVALLGNPFRAATQTEVLGPIKDRQIVNGAWSVELVPGPYVVTQRRQDGTFHSRWTGEVPDSGSPVWLADCLTAVPSNPASVSLRAIASAAVDGSGHLQVTYTDGTTVDAGPVVGPQGPPWTGSATEFGQAVADEIDDETGPANASLRAALGTVQPTVSLAVPTHSDVGQYRPIGLLPADKTLLGWYFAGGVMVRSTDDGANWVTWNNPSGSADIVSRGVREIRFTGDGEAVIIVQAAAGAGESLWRSTGLDSNPATATWASTLQLAEDLSFSFGSLSVVGDIVVASEYGPQTNSGAPATARRAYLSTDGGATFSEIFDLNTTTVTGESGPWGSGSTGQHPHGCCYDVEWDRIWLAVGDGGNAGAVNAVIYSDDAGTTWNVYPGTKSTTGAGQVVVPVSLPHAVLFLSDLEPNGVRRIGRTGYRTGGSFQTVHMVEEGAGIQAIGRHAWQNPEDGSPLLLSFTGVLHTSPGTLVVTFDGRTFFDAYVDPSEIVGGANYTGLERAFGPTNTGKIAAYLNNSQRFANGSRLTGYLIPPTAL